MSHCIRPKNCSLLDPTHLLCTLKESFYTFKKNYNLNLAHKSFSGRCCRLENPSLGWPHWNAAGNVIWLEVATLYVHTNIYYIRPDHLFFSMHCSFSGRVLKQNVFAKGTLSNFISAHKYFNVMLYATSDNLWIVNNFYIIFKFCLHILLCLTEIIVKLISVCWIENTFH